MIHYDVTFVYFQLVFVLVLKSLIFVSEGTRPLQYPAKVVVPIQVTKEELTEIANVHRLVFDGLFNLTDFSCDCSLRQNSLNPEIFRIRSNYSVISEFSFLPVEEKDASL